MTLRFPDGFYWGASTAAHQVEGNNIHSDFWVMENLEGSIYREPSGIAVDHYNRFKEDIALLASFGLNSYRFSIEWARIEPEEGKFDKAALEHYREVLLTCQSLNVTPVVTLHHFSSPQWLIRAGGWESEDTPERFARYGAYVMKELGDLIPYVCTINEANISIGIAKIIKRHQSGGGGQAQVGINTDNMSQMQKYFIGVGKAFGLPPQEVHSFHGARSDNGLDVIFRSHTKAREAIRQASPNTRIGLSLSLYDIQSITGGVEQAAQAWDEEFLRFLPYLQDDDYFGVQNYTRMVYGPDGALPVPADAEKTQMGNEYYPEALGAVVRYVSKHLDKPLLITENGIATDDDSRRVEFIERALKGVHACLAEGIPVLGYLHWSLLDNFEWQLGFSKRFGLIGVDLATQERKPKPSASFLGTIAINNTL